MFLQGAIQHAASYRRLTIAALAALGLGVCPANAADSDGTAKALVIQPLSLIKTADLDFGMLVSGSTGGSVTITPSTNALSSTGGVTPIGGGAHRATFQGAARVGLIVLINGSNTATLTRAGGGAPPMTANLTRTYGSGINVITLPIVGTVTVVATGLQTYYVGGTLNVPANQPDGDYSGTFNLTVTYF